MRLLPYGDTAVLVELDDGGQVAALQEALTDSPGVEELVPAARTLLVTFDREVTNAVRVRATVEVAAKQARGTPRLVATEQPPVVLRVSYDGPDLDFAAEHTGLPVDEVIARHVGGAYTVAFCGFAPGFAYLAGLDPALQLPRRDTPRAQVPAGSVGIAGEYTAAYPRSSPGGWHLLGRTDAPLWDLSRPHPALLEPGTRVRFEAT
jgi:5-oxoprolinase (ATP-hydrolysing) subunit B